MVVFFFKPLRLIVIHHPKRLIAVAIGTLPLFPLALFLKPMKGLMDSPQYLGWFFLLTAFLLWIGPKIGRRFARHNFDPSPSNALTIGAFQALATLPGVSRSGATISAALGVGLEREHAVLFSFMLAIPATLGGICLLLLESFVKGPLTIPSIGYLQYALGFGTSLAVGILALRLVLRLVSSDKFSIFVWYCLFLGLTTLIITSGHHVEKKESQEKEHQVHAFKEPRQPTP
jgi:undecaprenyl-diphosphatase